eukprot:GCRY01000041.1.p1 GENE.GCRY01000041.1~~GCRY01000041.1.p1  ORF type:complete len:160 (+),score=41.18 GCRY01000041.1:56-535(+)
MATTEVQVEKAFQKQESVFLAHKSTAKKSRKGQRFYKDIGLGFKTPREAIEGTYVDKKCPWTGNVSIRGRILRGVCVSNKMKRTVILRRDYLHYIKKYSRFEKRHKNIAAHLSPCFMKCNEGDIVTIGQCRPLSKTVRFNVLKIEPVTRFGAKKQFRMF